MDSGERGKLLNHIAQEMQNSAGYCLRDGPRDVLGEDERDIPLAQPLGDLAEPGR